MYPLQVNTEMNGVETMNNLGIIRNDMARDETTAMYSISTNVILNTTLAVIENINLQIDTISKGLEYAWDD
jgi:hypothetical protein